MSARSLQCSYVKGEDVSDRADEGGIMRGCRVSQREVNGLKVSWSSALLTWRKSAVQRRVSHLAYGAKTGRPSW